MSFRNFHLHKLLVCAHTRTCAGAAHSVQSVCVDIVPAVCAMCVWVVVLCSVRGVRYMAHIRITQGECTFYLNLLIRLWLQSRLIGLAYLWLYNHLLRGQVTHLLQNRSVHVFIYVMWHKQVFIHTLLCTPMHLSFDWKTDARMNEQVSGDT